MIEFDLPEDPNELFNVDSSLEFKVQQLTDYEDNVQALGDAADSIAFTLCDQDPLCIVQQENFDQLCSIVRCFHLLEGSRRRQLLDALCSSLTCLNAWIDKLMSTPADAIDRDALMEHRSAFKAYLFFLHWTSISATRESASAATASQATSMATGATKGSRGRKKAVEEMTGWDWDSQFPKIMKTVSQAMNTDLWALFRPNRPDENVLVKLIQLAMTALEQPTAAKQEELAGGAAHVLAVCALQYGQLEQVASSLVDALNKFEHTPPLVAELLRYSVAQWDDGRLAAAVLGEVASVDPAEYERQQNATGEKAGVRSIAEFVQEMANRMPRLMAHQISLLLPHLGGKAWTLRSGIITAIGFLLHKAFDSASSQEAADAQGVAARLRSKQHLLDVLCERVRDQSSYTRKAVLQTWQYLAENRAVPLGHWQVVTEIANGRLEDKSSLVRKEALRLLQALMLHNPFGPQLPVERFDASLAAHKAMLDQVLPPDETPEVEMKNDTMTENIAVEKPSDDAEEESNEEQEEGAEEEVKEEKESGEEEAAVEAPPARPGKTPAEVGWDGSVEELQALVASLELAVDFARSLTGCMPILTQLLASSTISDVQEAIAMLLTCKQFTVAGAPETIRKMLPLVFSRDQAIKDRIIEALDQLYVTGWAGNNFTSAQAARNLVGLAAGATLGELGALEDILKEFVFRGFVTPVMLHELWEVASTAHAAVSSGAQGAGRALRDLRAALAILSFAAAHQPDNVTERHVEMFLRFGLGDARCADALTSRHACFALVKLSDNFALGLYDGVKHEMHASLVRTLVASPLPEDAWYSAAESAITALYVLHPQPELICAAVLRRLGARANFNALDNGDQENMSMNDKDTTISTEDGMDCDDDTTTKEPSVTVSGAALSRLFFVLGQIALQHLVYVERLAKSVRRQRMEEEKKAAEDKAERAAKRGKKGAVDDEDEDINAELGVGSVAADAELDAMKDACESQILSIDGLLGPYARLVSAMCHGRALLSGDPRLRSSALLALCKLMAVDAKFCDNNLQLIFTLLQNRSVEAGLRCNLIVALGDLALRFPNHLEPWTEHVYRPLSDPDVAVRKNALMVLTHLILNDMMKVKGHIAKMAVCLEDEDSRIAALAQLFFHELAKKEYKGTSPIYNLLPDILSNLSSDTTLSRGRFQSVMQQLLSYIKKDKQGDALVDKLCQRIASTEDRAQWRNVAFCLTQLPLSEKGLKRLAENFKLYKPALADAEVTESITGILTKAKKNAAKSELKQMMEELEVKITDAAAERAEEEKTAAAARKRAAKDRGEDVSDDEEESDDVVMEDGSTAADKADVVVKEEPAGSDEMVEVDGAEGENDVEVVGEMSPMASEAISLVARPSIKEEVQEPAASAIEEAAEEEPVVAVKGRKGRTTKKQQEEEQQQPEEVSAQSGRGGATRRGTRKAVATAAVSSSSTDMSSRRASAASEGGADSVDTTASAKPAARATRGGARSKAAAKVKEEDEPTDDVPMKKKTAATRGTRRTKASAVIVSDDEEGDDARIAAVQAGVGGIAIKSEEA